MSANIPIHTIVKRSSLYAVLYALLFQGAKSGGWGPRTNPHNDEKARHEPPQVNDGASITLHEIIWVGGAPAYPVRQWGDHIGCDDEEREVVLVEGGGKDDEEEADGEDLVDVC